MLDIGNRELIDAENVFMGKKVLAAHAGPLFMPYPKIVLSTRFINRITRDGKSQANETKKILLTE